MQFRTPSVTLESLGENLTTAMLKNWKKISFYTNVPVSYTEKIVNEVVPNIGVAFQSEKDIYQVEVFIFLYPSIYWMYGFQSSDIGYWNPHLVLLEQLADSTKPDSTLSCKCSVKDGKLQLYKARFIIVLLYWIWSFINHDDHTSMSSFSIWYFYCKFIRFL